MTTDKYVCQCTNPDHDERHCEKLVKVPGEKGEDDCDREKDIRKVCEGVIYKGIESTGDYGSGGMCPFCKKDCDWDANSLYDISHEPDCIFLIAKDLITNQ